MNYQSRHYTLRLANDNDACNILNVIERSEFSDQIGVKFSRSPNPIDSYLKEGDRVIIPVAVDNLSSKLVGSGSCVVRKAHINGSLKNTAYLTDLKLASNHQKKFGGIKLAYKLIGDELEENCDYAYTTILSENKRAIALLEKKRPGMPPYLYAGDYKIHCLLGGGSGEKSVKNYVSNDTAGLSEFYDKNLPNYQLSPSVEFADQLFHGGWYTLRDDNGEIIGACSVWNQQSWKQCEITHYKGVLSMLQYLPTQLLGYPQIARVGQNVNYASLTMFLMHPDKANLSHLFIKEVASRVAGYQLLLLGLHQSHPSYGYIEQLKHISYTSRFYSVGYKNNTVLDKRPIMLEVGLL